ncbi:hypothetical protein [Botrimarina hoheduenensis]|uniref:Heparinase II/III-like protein n=1 Tax=Botrimarina hoheduenensis TaxID=2528000 RepID=A0A5C5VNJ8_9BACT|nr:hypothetical protein [Botrimarina hoheduenensis]TWT40256.1 hypothetical protein Pla111_33880 [Botrimarina hoheduenensis]
MAGATIPALPTTELSAEPFGELSAKQLWRSEASARVRAAWKSGDRSAAWELYRAELAKAASDHALATRMSAIAWGIVEPSELCARLVKAAKRADKLPAKLGDLEGAANDWLDSLETASLPTSDDQTQALDAIAWGVVVTAVPGALPTPLWLQMVQTLLAIAEEATHPGESLEEAPPARTIVATLLASELPLLLATGLSALRPAHTQLEGAWERLSESLVELSDGEGAVGARLLPALPLLLASWTRCRRLGQATRRGAWSSDAQTQYEWMVRHALRLIDSEGYLPLARDGGRLTPMIAAALKLDGDTEDLAAAARRLGIASKHAASTPPDPSVESEWAQCAVLSSGWNPQAPQVVVSWDQPTMRIKLRAQKQTLLEGDWPLAVRRDGKPLVAVEAWESQCWYSDQDCDYLELATRLSDGARLERQVILGRQHGVLAIAELVIGGGSEAVLESETQFSLAAGARFAPEAETRDGVIQAAGKPAAAVFPASLAEWRVEHRGGELSESEGTLSLRTTATGRNLASVLWFDLAPKRFMKQRTWRRLTVAQSLKRVTPDVAVGYRIQSGKDQWFYYRTLDPPANRTVLGQNLSSEAFVGRFLPTGEVDEYFEIEAEF